MGISFHTHAIFGPGFPKLMSRSEWIVAKFINKNALNMDGTIDMANANLNENGKDPTLSRKNLWMYIYYLWQNNKVTVPVFERMMKNDRASAELFAKEVVEYLAQHNHVMTAPSKDAMVSEFDLVTFINFVVEETPELQIPFLSSIFDRIIEKEKIQTMALEAEKDRIKEKIEDLEEEIDLRRKAAEDPFEYTVEGSEPVKMDTRGRPVTVKIV